MDEQISLLNPEDSIKYKMFVDRARGQRMVLQHANKIAVDQLEARLQKNLPRSYRDFLLAGGAQFSLAREIVQRNYPEVGQVFRRGELVDKFALLAPDAQKIARQDRGPVTDEQYYRYGYDDSGFMLSDTSRFFVRHIDHLVLVGQADVYGWFLLNPREVSKDEEWEAWLLTENLSGAARYRSFAEMMQGLYFAEIGVSSNLRGMRSGGTLCGTMLFDAALPPFVFDRKKSGAR